TLAVDQCDHARALPHLDAGITYCVERDLDAWTLYMTGYRARLELDRGRWDEAASLATAVLRHQRMTTPRRLTPLVVVGRLRARHAGEAVALDAVAEARRRELEGALECAGALWAALGFPFESALALAQSGTQAAQRGALAELQRLGARPAAARVARTLRERGARGLRRGPRAATREHPAGLTARALEAR